MAIKTDIKLRNQAKPMIHLENKNKCNMKSVEFVDVLGLFFPQ